MNENENLVYVKKHARFNKSKELHENPYPRNTSANSLSKHSLSSVDTSPTKKPIHTICINLQKNITKHDHSRIESSSRIDDKKNQASFCNEKYSIKDDRDQQMSISNVSQLLNLFQDNNHNDFEEPIVIDSNNCLDIIPEINTIYTPKYGFKDEFETLPIQRTNIVDSDSKRNNNAFSTVASYNDIIKPLFPISRYNPECTQDEKRVIHNITSKNFSKITRNNSTASQFCKNSTGDDSNLRTSTRSFKSSEQQFLYTQTDYKASIRKDNQQTLYENTIKEGNINNSKSKNEKYNLDTKKSQNTLLSLVLNMMRESPKKMKEEEKDETISSFEKIKENLKKTVLENKGRDIDLKTVVKLVNLRSKSGVDLAPIPKNKNNINYEYEKHEYYNTKGNAVLQRRKKYSYDIKKNLNKRLDRDVNGFIICLKYEGKLRKIQKWWKKIYREKQENFKKILKIQSLVRIFLERKRIRRLNYKMFVEKFNLIIYCKIKQQMIDFYEKMNKIKQISRKIVLIQSVFRSHYYKLYTLIYDIPIMSVIVKYPSDFLTKFYRIKFILRKFYKKLHKLLHLKQMKPRITCLNNMIRILFKKRYIREMVRNYRNLKSKIKLSKQFFMNLNRVFSSVKIRKFYHALSRASIKYKRKITIIGYGLKMLLYKILLLPFIKKLHSYKNLAKRKVIHKILFIIKRTALKIFFKRVMKLRNLERKWKALMKTKMTHFEYLMKKKFFMKFIKLNNPLNKNNSINIIKALLNFSKYVHLKVSKFVLKLIFFKNYKLKKLVLSKKKKEESIIKRFFDIFKKNSKKSQIFDYLRKIKLKLILFNTEKTRIQIMVKNFKKYQRNSKDTKVKQKNLIIKAGFLYLVNILYKSIRNSFKFLQKNRKFLSDFTRIMKKLDKKIKIFHFISFYSKLTLNYTNTLKRKNKLNTLKHRLIYLENILSYNKTICFIMWKNNMIYLKNDNKSNSVFKKNKIKRYIHKLKSKKKGSLLLHFLSKKVEFHQNRLRCAINLWKNNEIIIYNTRRIKHLFNYIIIIYRIRFLRNLKFALRSCNCMNLFTEFLVIVLGRILMKNLFNKLNTRPHQKIIQNNEVIKKILSNKIKKFVTKKEEKLNLPIQHKLKKWINIVKQEKVGSASNEISGYFSKLLKRTNINKAKNIVKMKIKLKQERIRDKLSVLMNNWNRIAKIVLFESSVEVLQKFLRKKLENNDKAALDKEGSETIYKKLDRNDFTIRKHNYK